MRVAKHEGIEIARLIGLIAVIAIHAGSAFGDYHNAEFVSSELSRFAVPMFFIASGYFWKDDFINDPPRAIVPLFHRVLVPFVVWVIIYWALDRFELFYARTYFGSPKSYLLFMVSGGIGFHLWFLPALFIGTTFCLYLLKHVPLKTAIVAALFLYVSGCLIFYSAIATTTVVYDISYRNGLLFAPIFLLVGYASKKYQAQNHIGLFLALFTLICGTVLHLSEGYFLTNLFPKGHEMSFGTVPMGIGAFWTAMLFPKCSSQIAMRGAYVFDGYLVHLLILNVILHHVDATGPGVFLAVVCVTLVLSLGFSRIKSWMQEFAALNVFSRSPPP